MSKLSLPLEELKAHVERYLLLKELSSQDVALFSLSIELNNRREQAYAFYFSQMLVDLDKGVKDLALLDTLEDRFVNAVVITMIASERNRFYPGLARFNKLRKAHAIFNEKKEESLSPIELFFKAEVMGILAIGNANRYDPGIPIYEKLCKVYHFKPAFHTLASIYLTFNTRNIQRGLEVLEEGVVHGCTACLGMLADCLVRYRTIDTHTIEINVLAAKHGFPGAIKTCNYRQWLY